MYAEIVLKSSKADTAFDYSKIYLTEFEIMITDGVFMDRIDKINYYLDIAETVLERGTCLRRNFGAIIVNNDQTHAAVSCYNPNKSGSKFSVKFVFISFAIHCDS